MIPLICLEAPKKNMARVERNTAKMYRAEVVEVAVVFITHQHT